MHSAIGKVSQPSGTAAVARGPAGGESHTVESLGWALREALPPLRLHSVSIYDAQGNVLWLSEGALGPDEHALVVEALEGFASEGKEQKSGRGQRLEDGRTAAFLAVRAPQGFLVGLVMVLADFKLAGEGLLNRISTAPVREVALKLAALLRPAGPRAEQDPTHMMLSLADDQSPPSVDPPDGGGSHSSREVLAPSAVDEILENGGLTLELEPPEAPPAPAAQSVPVAQSAPAEPPAVSTPAEHAAAAPAAESVPAAGAASESVPVALEVQPFVKLRAGGRTRRFEVLPRGTARQNRDPAALDVLAVDGLLSWLAAHREAWTQEPTGFTLNLSIATLEDERFLRRLAGRLGKNGISADTLGFEIAEPLCTQRRAQVERFISGCERLGCFVVIDGFSFDSAVVPLLRSKAVRLVKIDSRLTASVLKDKLSQALVVAIVQAVKVLGIHCAAQQVDTQLAVRWLTAVGCDFAQGRVLARPQPIERLEQPGTD